MSQKNRGRAAVGCLCIDAITSGSEHASGRFIVPGSESLRAVGFVPENGEGLWDGLRTAYQRMRSGCGLVAVAARGTGCAAALALAEQLPVDRLALVDPALSLPRGADRRGEAARLCAFARRNLSLVACDVLAVQTGASAALRRAWFSPRCRLTWLSCPGEGDGEMYRKREIEVKQAISCFLQTGELPKSLAENPEMCIIYG